MEPEHDEASHIVTELESAKRGVNPDEHIRRSNRINEHAVTNGVEPIAQSLADIPDSIVI